jgi:hypothetical protein
MKKHLEQNDFNAKIEARRRLASTNLKCCPVCETLNSAANAECFVCRWHGRFISDAAAIEKGLRRLLRKCPDYRVRHLDVPIPAPAKKLSKWGVLFRRVISGPLDYRV